MFNWKPLCVNLWPPRHFDEKTEADNRYIMVFDSLAPGEYLTCEIFSINYDLPRLLTVRSDQCVAKTVEMMPQPVIADWQRRLGVVLGLAGFVLLVYGSIVLLQFLVLRTPFGH